MKETDPVLIAEQRRTERFPKYCQYPKGCLRFPCWGVYFEKIPRFCKTHRHDHHLDVRHTARNLFMGKTMNGTQVLEIQNVPVVEDPKDADDTERLIKAFEPFLDCALCGNKGAPSLMYYDFPFKVSQCSTVNIQKEAYFATTGREVSSSTEVSSNFTLEGIPPGPYMTDGDEEWRRFEGTQEGEDLRTNKDVEEARTIREMYEEELLVAEAETPAEREAYVQDFLRKSRELQQMLRVTGPEGGKRAVVGAAVKGRNKKPDGAPGGKGAGPSASKHKGGNVSGEQGKKTAGGNRGLLESFSDSEEGT